MPDIKPENMDSPSPENLKTPKPESKSAKCNCKSKTVSLPMKLATARLDFLNARVSKSGKNNHLQFKYFELDDIVPTAIRVCKENGILVTMEMGDDHAKAWVMDAEDIHAEPITFSLPFREVPPIVNKEGQEVTNPLQRLGSSVTYLRRYLWMLVMDVTEPDEIDATLTQQTSPTTTIPTTSEAHAPATPEQRLEAKATLTAPPADRASEEEINTLKAVCKKLMAIDPAREPEIQQIAVKTNGFSTLTSEKCTQLVTALNSAYLDYPEEMRNAVES